MEFDRIAECDYCGEKKKVAVTQYGTTHYNRLICEECTKRINAEAEITSGIKNVVEKHTK